MSLETPTGTASRGPTGMERRRKGRSGKGATGRGGGGGKTISRSNTHTTSTKDEVGTYKQARHGRPRHARNSVAISTLSVRSVATQEKKMFVATQKKTCLS